MTRRHFAAIVPIAVLVMLAACEHTKSANPLSPTIAGPIPGVEITQPVLLEPGQGVKFKDKEQPITLLIENASTTGVRPLVYAFQIAADAGFTNIVFSRRDVPQGDGGRTSLRLQDKLSLGRTYYWRAWAYDGANTGAMAASRSFDVYPPVVINPPALVSPSSGSALTSLSVGLVVNNSTRSGPAGNVHYVYQVSTNQAFTSLLTGNSDQAENRSGQTTWAPSGLTYSTTYYWRVSATDNEASSGWSQVWTFRTPAPAPTPSPSPNPTPCGPPYPTTAFGIVECQRSHYAHMSSSEMVSFLRGVAKDLNSAGIAGGPFGLLRKSGGSNCGGYSCDIICAGQGTSQKQWDVLGDADGAQTPAWIGPKVYPDIRMDTCEIQ